MQDYWRVVWLLLERVEGGEEVERGDGERRGRGCPAPMPCLGLLSVPRWASIKVADWSSKASVSIGPYLFCPLSSHIFFIGRSVEIPTHSRSEYLRLDAEPSGWPEAAHDRVKCRPVVTRCPLDPRMVEITAPGRMPCSIQVMVRVAESW